MLVTIDTGGTKTLIASFDKKGKMGASIKFPTPHDQREYVKTIKEVVRENYGAQKVDAIILALPGMIKNGVVKWAPNLGWVNFQAYERLRDILPGVPLLIENDANLAGLSETRALTKTPKSSLYITISTGIGSGFITDGNIDPAFVNTEAGHMLLEYDGRLRRWEEFSSGSAIVKVYKKFARDITSKRSWRQIADRMSRGFLVTIPIYQPEVIIIGGSVGTYFDRYRDELAGILREKLPEHIPMPKFRQALHPEQAVIFGCYYYGRDYLAAQKSRK